MYETMYIEESYGCWITDDSCNYFKLCNHMILVTCKLGLIREFISFPELSVEQQKKSKISFLLNKPHGVFRNYKYQNTLK